MITSAYIHIPFCRRKCNYCTFASFTEINLKNTYINNLCKEIQHRYKGEKLKTLYIGGGTPSLLDISDIKRVLSLFVFDSDYEITCEVNPENLSSAWLQSLFQSGINRISIGAQSFNDKLLKIIGRKHSVKDIFNTVINARNAGFSNISVDLIYGIPNQSVCDVSSSVITACELDLEHISTYGLKIEPGSFFYKNLPKNLPDEDMQADMYLKINEICHKYGYHHYEISNFAKKNFISKHNLNYWNAKEYYGFGCASAGYENLVRYSHLSSIEKYCLNPLNLTDLFVLNTQYLLEEYIFLGLRKAEGISTNEIYKKFNINFDNKYEKILSKYSKYFVKTNDRYSLTENGFLISNCILSEFIN